MKAGKPRRKGGLGVALYRIQRTPAESARMRRAVVAYVAQVERHTPPLLVRLALFRAAPRGGCSICWRDMVSGESCGRGVYACNRGDTRCSSIWRRYDKRLLAAQQVAKASLLQQVAA